MICALVAHADVNNFLTAFAIALVLEVKPENFGNRFLHLYNLYSVLFPVHAVFIIRVDFMLET
jgi:hypothetical protein